MNYSWGVALFAVSAFVAAFSQMLLKKSATLPHDKWYKAYLNPLVITAYALLFSTALMNMLSFMHVPFKTGNMLITTSYIFVLFWSRYLFKEKFTKHKIIGMVLILAGIVVFVLG